MKLNLIVFFMLAGTLAFFNACNTPAKSVLLKFNLEKGKAYSYDMDFNMDQAVQGSSMSSKMRFSYSIEVTDDQNGIKTLRSTYDRIAMNMRMPNNEMNIDTDSSVTLPSGQEMQPLNMMRGMFQAMKGKSFYMKVNPEGEVIEVKGMREMAEDMVNGMNIDPAQKPMILQNFSAQFNDENMKKNFGQVFNIFPAKPVKEGESWVKKMSLPGMAGMDMNTTYTVKEINGNKVTLETKALMKTNNVEGQQNGTLFIDARTGLVTEANIEQKFGPPMNMTSKGKIVGREK